MSSQSTYFVQVEEFVRPVSSLALWDSAASVTTRSQTMEPLHCLEL